MSLGEFLYLWLAAAGVTALALVIPVLRNAHGWRAIGLRSSTMLVLAGLDLASGQRFTDPPPLPATVIVGLFLMDIGMTGWVLFFETGLINGIAAIRARRRG